MNVVPLKERATDLLWTNGPDILETVTDWLWYPYIAAEHINLVAGMGNEGKGLVCTHIAACVTRGRAFPESAEKCPPGDVLWLELEDDLGSAVIPRLKCAGADIKRMQFLNPDSLIHLSRNEHIEAIGRAILQYKPRLVVLSPMNSFLGAINTNDEMEVRAAFEKLRNYTKGLGTVIIGITHANKKIDLSAIERINGSVAYANYCRCVVLVTAEIGGKKGQRRFINGKWNYSDKAPDLLYTPYYDGNDPKKRDQYVRLSWDIALSDVDYKKAFTATEENKKETASEWLLRVLEGGPVAIPTLKDMACKARHKQGTIDQTRTRLNASGGEFSIRTVNGSWTLVKRMDAVDAEEQ